MKFIAYKTFLTTGRAFLHIYKTTIENNCENFFEDGEEKSKVVEAKKFLRTFLFNSCTNSTDSSRIKVETKYNYFARDVGDLILFGKHCFSLLTSSNYLKNPAMFFHYFSLLKEKDETSILNEGCWFWSYCFYVCDCGKIFYEYVNFINHYVNDSCFCLYARAPKHCFFMLKKKLPKSLISYVIDFMNPLWFEMRPTREDKILIVERDLLLKSIPVITPIYSKNNLYLESLKETQEYERIFGEPLKKKHKKVYE
ncbi:hypothetical protein RFI_37797 [Reticulomyxa filosa]|uniref:Uncharacterized protein n=1 Tax=Reticulomyxa filosa TaxID=46433 RepID=X6LG12_RETFI|nr:hypothetical protein RFI_37797 [Reticulomyxa filosa]|eukprot:ETN99674.1 hypothetical protein RFI_37797 [Reticulomyxa filosa]